MTGRPPPRHHHVHRHQRPLQRARVACVGFLVRVGPVRLSILLCSALHIPSPSPDRESERVRTAKSGWECNSEGGEKAQENGRPDLALDDATGRSVGDWSSTQSRRRRRRKTRKMINRRSLSHTLTRLACMDAIESFTCSHFTGSTGTYTSITLRICQHLLDLRFAYIALRSS